jgi:hypothetical protein
MSVLWLWEHRAAVSPTGLLSLVLIVTVGLQGFLLPLLVGAMYPNLRPRELARPPEGLKNVSGKLWVVDRGAERTVLLSPGSNGDPALITVKTDALDGIATIARPLRDILSHGDLVCSAGLSSRLE